MRLVALIPLLLCFQGCRTKDLRGDESICVLHQVPLRDDTLRISYGTPASARLQYWRAHAAMFPNATSWVGGGCTYWEGHSADYAKVHYCGMCREVESTWLREHGGIDDKPTQEAPPNVAR